MPYQMLVVFTVGPILGVMAYLVRWALTGVKDSALLAGTFISIVPILGLCLAFVFALIILLELRAKITDETEF